MTSTSTSTTSRATSSSTTSNQPPAEVYILFIVAPTFGLPGTGDLLYELDLSSNGKREDSPHLAQFIASSSLDELDAQLLLQQQAVNTPGQLFFKFQRFSRFRLRHPGAFATTPPAQIPSDHSRVREFGTERDKAPFGAGQRGVYEDGADEPVLRPVSENHVQFPEVTTGHQGEKLRETVLDALDLRSSLSLTEHEESLLPGAEEGFVIFYLLHRRGQEVRWARRGQ
ncbi:unnamed protein product [Amoebophrya sp. A120]|nr:unnamed protein product [Amoebophrya sp. A120]|eukprot:GSA120T00014093001.1